MSELNPEFDKFWAEKAQETDRLFAKRTSEIMRWHFDPPGGQRVARMLGCYEKGRLVGYAIVRHEMGILDGLRRSVIADLMTNDEDPSIVDSVIAAAHGSAKKAGSHVLEILGFPRAIREILVNWKPYKRDYPSCPFFYKTRDRALQAKLANENLWYATPFDGDTTLWP